MAFIQPPPELGNQYSDDRVLRSYLARALPPAMLRDIEPGLMEMGGLAGGALYRMQLADRLNEPRLTQWDAWGNRIDRVEVSPLWREAERIAATRGLVAIAYEPRHGVHARLHQFALVYLFTPSTDVYSCPLAMTDGAARALLQSGNQALIQRAVPHLTSRDPKYLWTSGQWMTESIGGSDVGLSETVARRNEKEEWRLFGRKWFTSAITSQMALTLARPEGNPPGGRGLALFYVETRDAEGRPNNMVVDRLKDKLGTRKVPTAELTLDGTKAELVMDSANGVRNIAPLLNITRTWNAVSSVAMMRRGIALARDYAHKRDAFGAKLAQKPLHVDTLAGLQAEMEGAFHLTFHIAVLLGREETDGLESGQAELLRIFIPIAKLTTAKQSVAVLSEVVESFGGAGYVEDTGVPTLLRDAQVFPIWEGTTNVLALDTLRAVQAAGGLSMLRQEVLRWLAEVKEPSLVAAGDAVKKTFALAEEWFKGAAQVGPPSLEAGARRFAMTLGRCLELALLLNHAQWSLQNEHDGRTAAAARRFCASGVDLIKDMDPGDAQQLANDVLE
ncbi:MAG TPA: acyl-CoA dehydrogenase family protein [Burkholderiales bacterium]|nr:acyl-CoA dehydrogenase family protein [Burkholderiales bacterium]